MYAALDMCAPLKKIGEQNFKPFNTLLDRGILSETIKSISNDLFLTLMDKYKFFSNSDYKVYIKVEFYNENLFFKGNYLKFSREIGQSPWFIDGERLGDSSVQEEIKYGIMELIDCEDASLHAGGREDRDVRMLGNGRPFIVELINPKNRQTYTIILNRAIKNTKEIVDNINRKSHLIEVRNFEVCDKAYFDEIRRYEDSKKKNYCCVVWASQHVTDSDIEKLNSIQSLDIIQKTPFRVLHRRTLIDRKKHIFTLNAKRINENFIILNVVASAGTYIKEFIHSIFILIKVI